MCTVTEVQFTVHFSKNLEDEQYILIEERVNCLTIKIVPSHGCHREEYLPNVRGSNALRPALLWVQILRRRPREIACLFQDSAKKLVTVLGVKSFPFAYSVNLSFQEEMVIPNPMRGLERQGVRQNLW